MTPSTSSSPWAPSPTACATSSTTCARQGGAPARVGVTIFRPFPADELASALASAHARGGHRADRRARRVGQSADARDSRPRSPIWPPTASRIPRVVSASAGLGSRDVASADLRRRIRLAARSRRAWTERPYVVLGIKHALALEAPDDGAAPERRLQPARPLHRRLRVGHRQQAAGHRRRRAVRPVRAGLSALRLGEARPADDLLPDHRRRSPSASTASCARSSSCRSTTWRLRPGRRRWPAWSTAARSS